MNDSEYLNLDRSNSSISETISGQLALETLNSLRNILFPWDDKSQKFLRSLVSKSGFDPDCLSFGSAGYRREIESGISYYYWGSRLMDLYDEIENPKPRGTLQEWLEKRSKARHMMMAAIAGVLIAVFLGFLSLAVTIFQAWVSYRQLKYSIPGTGSSPS
jgi:hypothetical protein